MAVYSHILSMHVDRRMLFVYMHIYIWVSLWVLIWCMWIYEQGIGDIVLRVHVYWVWVSTFWMCLLHHHSHSVFLSVKPSTKARIHVFRDLKYNLTSALLLEDREIKDTFLRVPILRRQRYAIIFARNLKVGLKKTKFHSDRLSAGQIDSLIRDSMISTREQWGVYFMLWRIFFSWSRSMSLMEQVSFTVWCGCRSLAWLVWLVLVVGKLGWGFQACLARYLLCKRRYFIWKKCYFLRCPTYHSRSSFLFVFCSGSHHPNHSARFGMSLLPGSAVHTPSTFPILCCLGCVERIAPYHLMSCTFFAGARVHVGGSVFIGCVPFPFLLMSLWFFLTDEAETSRVGLAT